MEDSWNCCCCGCCCCDCFFVVSQKRRRGGGVLFLDICVLCIMVSNILLSFVLLICKLDSRDIPKSLNQPKMTITIKIAQNINYHKSHIIIINIIKHQTNFYQSNPFTTTFQSCKNSFSTPSTTPSTTPSQFLPHSFNNLFIIYFFLSRLNNT